MTGRFGMACTLVCLIALPAGAQDVLSETTPDALIRQLTPHGSRDLGGGGSMNGESQPKGGVQFQGSTSSQTYQDTQPQQTHQQPAADPAYGGQQSGTYQAPAQQGYEAKPQTYEQPAGQTYQQRRARMPR